MLAHTGIAILAFALTNIDDLLVLSIYFADPGYSRKNIVIGQFLGIITLIVLSLSGLLVGAFLEHHWISLLGAIPLSIGIRVWLQRKKNGDVGMDQHPDTKSKLQFLSIAFVTIANGGDNVGVYAPLFANVQPRLTYLYVGIFLALTVAWCAIAYYATRHPVLKQVFSKYGKTILPLFLITLGLFILRDFAIWATEWIE